MKTKIRNLIRSQTKTSDNYDHDKKYMKIKLNSDDELYLNKMAEISTIVVRAIFFENNKYYHQHFSI